MGLSQDAFAKKLNTSQSNYSKYELGKVIPTYPFLISLILKLNVNIHWLLIGEGEMFLDQAKPIDERKSLSSDIITERDVVPNEDLKEALTAFTAALNNLYDRISILENEIIRLKEKPA